MTNLTTKPLSNKLHYAFDFFFDIKSLEELYKKIAEGDDYHYDMDFLYELMLEHHVDMPEGRKNPIDLSFPQVVWIDKHGGYLTEEPEEGDYQRMQRKCR